MAAFTNVTGRGDCHPRTDNCGDVFATFESQVKTVSRDEWNDASEATAGQEQLIQKIKDQGREGSCASNAAAQALEMVYVAQGGKRHWVELSAMSLYKRVGRSASSGSTINANLYELKETGILPVTNAANSRRFSHTMQPRGFSAAYPQGWRDTAKLFRVSEWWDIETFDGLASCLLRGTPVVYGRSGHAICGVRLVRRGGQWCIKYANSWGRWGDNGFGYDTESFVSGSIRSYGAWAPRVTTELVDNLPEVQV